MNKIGAMMAKTVLVIDDDAQIRDLLRQALEESGYEVRDACDGDLGIKSYRENPTDLVITDIIMPDKEGLETIMDFKREFKDVKIFAISGGGAVDPEEYLRMAKKIGALKTFVKPFSMREIIAAVDEMF